MQTSIPATGARGSAATITTKPNPASSGRLRDRLRAQHLPRSLLGLVSALDGTRAPPAGLASEAAAPERATGEAAGMRFPGVRARRL